MNLRQGYRHVLYQQLIGETEVAFRVVGWNFAFVAPEQMHVRPVDSIAPWTARIGEELIQEARCRSARQRHRCHAALDDGFLDEPCDAFCGRLGHGGFVGGDFQLRHSRPSRSISTSASGGPDDPGG